MPTTYSDQFFLVDPGNPPPAGTALTVNFLNYTDNNNDGWLTRPNGDSINGSDITRVWDGDTITVNMGGSTVTITGVTFYTSSGQSYFTPTDGTNLSNATFISSTYVTSSSQIAVGSLGPPCFTAGTMIRTNRGEVAIEDLRAGDLVETLDHGLQAVRWIGRSPTDASGDHAPVVFKPGAIGNESELRVSPQHRLLVQGWRAQLFFGADEVLVPAKSLLNGRDVIQERSVTVEYFHILFDRHEVIWGSGVASESFFPGDQILLQDRAVRAELFALFPELADGTAPVWAATARQTIKCRDAGVLRLAA